MKFSIPLLLAALAPSSNAQSVIGLHGSGTTNPSKCYWHIMDQLQVQTKLPVKMTYRAIGSSDGQVEFIGDVATGTPDSDFGSGDIPLSESDFSLFPDNSILHLPFVLGAISFFHSVPTGNEGLHLSPCVLAKILNLDITDWTDPEILLENPNLSLPSPYPITVAHRVKGSSSTASITQYLNQVCPAEWPDTLVGKTINWKTDTIGCEGSGGMTDCISSTPGTIGYIDSGHGHAEGLQEIELKNADGIFVSSKQAADRGGIMAATENAGLPVSLDGSFAGVNLLNRPGASTWPIVAISYIYVRKDLTTFMQGRPASQTLLKAFLKALYMDEYITSCEEEFGFLRVTGDLRQKALDAIDALVITAEAPEWTYEFKTASRTGQADYVISAKRQSYSEVEQDNVVDMVALLQLQIDQLKAEKDLLEQTVASLDNHGHATDTHDDSEMNGVDAQFFESDFEQQQETQLMAALALSSISFIFWIVALIFLLVKYALGI